MGTPCEMPITFFVFNKMCMLWTYFTKTALPSMMTMPL